VLASGERLRIGNQVNAAGAAFCSGRSAGVIHLPANVRLYLCLSPCDMRRCFDGLNALVRDHLQLDTSRSAVISSASEKTNALPCCAHGRTADLLPARLLLGDQLAPMLLLGSLAAVIVRHPVG
jgi:hypothetical protein